MTWACLLRYYTLLYSWEISFAMNANIVLVANNYNSWCQAFILDAEKVFEFSKHATLTQRRGTSVNIVSSPTQR